MKHFFYVCVAAQLGSFFSSTAFSDVIKDDIYQIAGDIRNEVYSGTGNAAGFQRALSDVRSALNNIRGSGGDNHNVYCQRIRDTSFYAPTRVSDNSWLESNGTDLPQCQLQLKSARNDLICIRVNETQWYAPKIVSMNNWRGENGTDFGTCERQVTGSTTQIFCQRVRDTDFFAPARISTGEWLAANGTSLTECLSGIGNQKFDFKLKFGEPLTESAANSSTH